MKRLLLAGIAATLLASLSNTSVAQPCPFTVQFATYGGQNCSFINLPKLTGTFNGAASCSVALTCSLPPANPNSFYTAAGLVIGAQQISVSYGFLCPFLASPDVIVALPAQAGDHPVAGNLPPDPSLSGAVLHLQIVAKSKTTFHEGEALITGNGLRLSIL